MELRHINDVAHVITRKGKQETTTPASEVIAQSRQRIADARHMLASLEKSTAETQAALEAALLTGQPTGPIRSEIKTILELVSDQRQEAAEAAGDIALIHQWIDQQAATRIRLADQAAIAATTHHFNAFLENHQ